MHLLNKRKLMPQCICLTQANYYPSVFVRDRQIAAPVYLLDTGKFMPRRICTRHRQINTPPSVFVKQRQINAPVYLLETGKLMPQCVW